MNKGAVIALSEMDLDRPKSSPMTVQPLEHRVETVPRAQLMPVLAAPEKLSPREEAVRIVRAK